MLPGTFAECCNSKRDVHEHARHKGRAFGIGTGEKAAPPKFKATRVGTLDMMMEIEPLEDAFNEVGIMEGNVQKVTE